MDGFAVAKGVDGIGLVWILGGVLVGFGSLIPQVRAFLVVQPKDRSGPVTVTAEDLRVRRCQIARPIGG